jgi:uncharacterized protein YkwD
MVRRLLVLALLASALTIGASGATASAGTYDYLLAPSTTCPNQTNLTLSATDQESVMRCMHNYARQRAGRAAVTYRRALATSSDGKSGDILACQQFSHTACGRSMTYWFNRVGYLSCSSWGVGENIAWGTGSYATVRSIMSGWVNSDGHRANILSSSYRDLGLGLRIRTLNGYSGAHVWTAHFGYHSGCW